MPSATRIRPSEDVILRLTKEEATRLATRWANISKGPNANKRDPYTQMMCQISVALTAALEEV